MEVEVFKGGFDRNLSYLLYDEKTKKAIVIDPFFDISVYLNKAKKLGVDIIGVLNTHSHRDHVEGNPFFEKIGVPVLNVKKSKVKVGKGEIKIIKVPGHHPDSVCFLSKNFLFTGDTLFAKRVGMTKIRSDSKELYKSLKKLMRLPNDTIVYPGHKYSENITTTIGKEKRENQYILCKNFKEFDELMEKWRGYHNNVGPMRIAQWFKYRYTNG